jgi:EpsI family protein
MALLNSLPARIVVAILMFQAIAYYAVASRSETIPAISPLATFPRVSGGWTAVQEYPLEKEVQDVLKADDTLNRVYGNSQRTTAASLFIAFFKTQRYGQSPHSPKNCLPGAGWQPTEDRRLSLQVPGRSTPIQVNQYVITRGDEASVVLYWYQSHSRVIAREVEAKFWLVADAVRYHRSDTALVRVIVPVRNSDPATAEKTAAEFVRAIYPDVVGQLPQ